MKAKIGAFFAALWISCTLLAHLSAQPEDIISRHYSMKDGLSHDYVTCIFQDSRGFLWVGTESGLNKFDGYHFTNYGENPSDSTSLTDKFINCLWEDQQQQLWIGTRKGLEVLDLKTEKFYHPVPDSVDLPQGSTMNVKKIRERTDGKLWICTAQGIYVADPPTLSMTRVFHFPQEVGRKSARRDNLHGNKFWDIAEIRDGSVWAASEDGLVHIDARTGKTTRYRYDPDDPHSLADDMVWTVHVDQHHRVWAGTSYGLDVFNPEDQSFTHFLPEQLQSDQSLTSSFQVRTLLEHPDGTFRVGFGNGLYAFDPETGAFDLLAGTSIWSMLQDRQGAVWFGSIFGLFQVAPQNKKFTVYRPFGTTSGSIFSIAEDTHHQIWISSFGTDFQLFRFDPSSRRFFQYLHNPLNPYSFSGNEIRGIVADRDGQVWMASYNKLEKFNRQQQTFTSVALPIDPATMLMDSRGKVWLGGWDQAGTYDPQTGMYERLAAFPIARVYSLLEVRGEYMWAGTSEGLVRYSLEADELATFQHDPADPQSLSHNRVYDLMMDKNGMIWLGTGGGLHQMIPGTERGEPRFVYWRTANSDLPHEDVFSVVDGGDTTLWLGCGNQISHFFPQTGEFRNYDYHDGLPGQQFSRGVGLRSRNGEMYFGSKDGLVVFHPDSLQDNTYSPPVAITGFSIHNQPMPVQGSYGDTLTWATSLAHVISYTDKVELSYQQNDLSLEFAALNFVNPENNLYKYKLEPYEADWIETSAGNRIARYTNLSPGHYTFRVIGSNNDGVWNETGSSLSIIIHPPWWQTGWAYALYTMLGIGLLYGLRQYTVNRERLKNDLKIKQLEAEKLQELDHLRARFFANISHEFRTPLTLILSPLEKLLATETEPGKNNLYQMMRRNASRLLNLISQLLDLSKLEAQSLKLETKPGNVIGFLQTLAASFTSLAESKHITFSTRFPSSSGPVFFDADKLEKIVVNLLSNAFKFTPEGGSVSLQVSLTKSEPPGETILSMVVQDTGVGIPEEEQEKVFDRFYQADSSQTRENEGAGIGLALAKELIELHRGNIRVLSQVGDGTSFVVELPLRMAAENYLLNLSDERAKLPKTGSKETALSLYEEGIYLEAESAHPTDEKPLLLIVEDNQELLDYLAMQFQADYQVIKAVNGKMGLQQAIDTIPDLIISDVMMPEMDGIALSRELKADERVSHIPIILLTAKAEEASKLEGLQTGADDYLAKPFSGAELEARIKNLIEGRKRLRERFGREVRLQPGEIAITSADEKFLQRVMTIVTDHLDKADFSLESFEKEVGMSHVQFYRKLKALTNQAPWEFLRNYRLQQAALLLKGQQGNVTEVAYAVGFSSLAYFTRCFKRFYGQTPTEYQAAPISNQQPFVN